MATENLIDVEEQLQGIVADFKRLLYGDSATRSTGLLVEFDNLRKSVAILESDVSRLKNKRPRIWSWVAGYVAFVAAVAFGVAALLNLVDTHDIWHLPPALGLAIAVGFAVVALVLFMVGFGWFDS